jgi:hypothetical protein
VGLHHDALLVAELAVELAGAARFLAALLLGKESPRREKGQRQNAKDHIVPLRGFGKGSPVRY